MSTFQHPLWGYEVTYPDDWVHATHGDVEAFAPHSAALDIHYEGERMGYLLLRAELNPYQKPIEPLWAEHLTRIAVMHAAKKVGSSLFTVGNAKGFEAELLLPRRENKRLWVGILSAGGIILHLMVMHRKTERAAFQPIVSKIVASLRFAASVSDVRVTPRGMPIPASCVPAPVEELFPQANPEDQWEAYRGGGAADALQIFYLREAPAHGWESLAYFPFPGKTPDITYATLLLHKEGIGAAVHILPVGKDTPLSEGNIVIQYPTKKG
jgi:hypothetical protein